MASGNGDGNGEVRDERLAQECAFGCHHRSDSWRTRAVAGFVNFSFFLPKANNLLFSPICFRLLLFQEIFNAILSDYFFQLDFKESFVEVMLLSEIL